MSVTIEADNYDEAIKQARKAKREATKQAKIDKENGEIAYTKAYAALGRVVARLMDENASCHYWKHLASVKCIRENTWECKFSVPDYEASTTFYRVKPLYTLLDGAGWILAVYVDEGVDQTDRKPAWYAVGVHENKVALTDIPKPVQEAIATHLLKQEQETA